MFCIWLGLQAGHLGRKNPWNSLTGGAAQLTPVSIHGTVLKALDGPRSSSAGLLLCFLEWKRTFWKRKLYQRHFNLREVATEKRKRSAGDAPHLSLEISSAEPFGDSAFLPVQ